MAAIIGTAAAVVGGVAAIKYFAGGAVNPHAPDLHGKVAVITGGNAGIGKATAVGLARLGARVIIACRDPTRMAAAVKEIQEKSGNDTVSGMLLNLGDTDSIKSFSAALHARVNAVNLLINNAATFGAFSKTKQGFESQMGVNHLGHFLLTALLVDLLKLGAPSRVVMVSSLSNEHCATLPLDDLMFERHPYSIYKAYCHSKLANVMFAKELNRRLASTGVTAYALHPGTVNTDILFNLPWPWKAIRVLLAPVMWIAARSEEQGAQTTLYAALAPSLPAMGGGQYLDNCAISKCNPLAEDASLCSALWARSEQLLNTRFPAV